MTISNSEIAAKFYEFADLLAIEGANPFRIRAYLNAANLISDMPHELADLIKEGKDLTTFPGIGKDLAEKITTIVATHELPSLAAMKQTYPPALSEMLLIPSLGPKRIKALFAKLHIKTIADLKKAAETDVISKIPNFGKKTQAKILAAILQFKGDTQRIKLRMAEQVAAPLVAYLQRVPGVKDVIVAGSYRRRCETVGDLDILVTKVSPSPVINDFVNYPDVKTIIARGETRAAVVLKSNIQVDLRAVEQKYLGAAQVYFTGSKDHIVVLRKMALKKKLKLNEYGIFRGRKWVAGHTEAEVYARLGLPYIEPELRENCGEIAAGIDKKLPKLITLADIKGDLHCHSQESSDAVGTLEELVEAAKSLNLQYLAITDHSQHLKITRGLNSERLLQQIKAIDKVNSKHTNFRLLKSLECDILKDGTLDLPNNILKELDFVVCSVHSSFNLSRQEQTERILRAMDNPYFNIFAHPTGRLLLARLPYEIDLELIMQEAKKRNVFLELNASPDRLDLNDVHCRMAKEIGVKIAISTDAHKPQNLQYMRYGIDQARRGWLEPDDVLNTRSITELLKLLRR
jgi:DNA polymerase (family X)